MSAHSNDTDPGNVPATTDPGLGVAVRTRTDPGVAPPSSRSPLEGPIEPPTAPYGHRPVDRSAPTPVPPIVRAQAAASPPSSPEQEADTRPVFLPVPAVAGEPTPVPPETDGLLSGLIASENEAYFRKAKAGSSSSGSAAQAFQSPLRPPASGNLTPPPEPPVVLRKSVEMELESVTPPPLRVRDTVPQGAARKEARPSSEPTVPPALPEGEKRPALAFGLAALLVGGVGIAIVVWLTSGGGSSSSTTVPASPTLAATAPPTPAQAPVPPPVPAPDPSPVATASAASAIAPADTTPVKAASPSPPPALTAVPRRPPPRVAASAPSAPPEYVPPPKDDVKRSM